MTLALDLNIMYRAIFFYYDVKVVFRYILSRGEKSVVLVPNKMWKLYQNCLREGGGGGEIKGKRFEGDIHIYKGIYIKAKNPF